MTQLWFRRCLGLCTPFIALLWVAGVAHFHGLELLPVEWFVTAAAVFALHTLWRRVVRPRPPPPLPPGANPVRLAALAAAFLAVPIGLLGGVFELLADSQHPSPTNLWLRCLWHTACSYAACYCSFLLRLTMPRTTPPPA